MTDEELLKLAEKYILEADGKARRYQACAQMSMACSQLVIARNSRETALNMGALLAFTETGPRKS